MAKLSKVEIRRHSRALEILQKGALTEEDKDVVFANYHEAATSINGLAGAFFTPPSLAWDAVLELGDNPEQEPMHIVDLCAGIGVLAYSALRRNPGSRVVCVEINPEYVEVGKKVVPEAEWHCLDVMDFAALAQLGSFDAAIANPPFGRVSTFSNKRGARYTGAEAEYKVIELAGEIARHGTFIVPQESAPFRFSGVQQAQHRETEKYQQFRKQTGLTLEFGIGIDCSFHGPWKGVKPAVELVYVDFCQREIDARQADLFAVAS